LTVTYAHGRCRQPEWIRFLPAKNDKTDRRSFWAFWVLFRKPQVFAFKHRHRHHHCCLCKSHQPVPRCPISSCIGHQPSHAIDLAKQRFNKVHKFEFKMGASWGSGACRTREQRKTSAGFGGRTFGKCRWRARDSARKLMTVGHREREREKTQRATATAAVIKAVQQCQPARQIRQEPARQCERQERTGRLDKLLDLLDLHTVYLPRDIVDCSVPQCLVAESKPRTIQKIPAKIDH